MTLKKTQFRLVLMHLVGATRAFPKLLILTLKQWQLTMNVRTVYYCHHFPSAIRKKITLVFVDNFHVYAGPGI